MTLDEAIAYAEDPARLAREFVGDERVRALKEMDELFALAERDQPLAWQAFRARAGRRTAADPLEVARRVTVRQQLGV